jgi:hypothetical protein
MGRTDGLAPPAPGNRKPPNRPTVLRRYHAALLRLGPERPICPGLLLPRGLRGGPRSPKTARPWAGAWLSLVERLLWEQDVGGSNPLAPTTSNPLFEAAQQG